MKTMSTRKKNSLTRRILFGLATATICFGSAASPVYADAPTTAVATVNTGDTSLSGTNAMPTGGTVPTGTDGKLLGNVTGINTVTNITADGVTKSTMNIVQTTGNAVIYWDSFNVGTNSTVNFIQTLNGAANTAAMTLNRITGTSPSLIQGNINSIGSLIFINPNGMLFDSGSVVNAAGIIASTAQLANGDTNFYDNRTNALLFA